MDNSKESKIISSETIIVLFLVILFLFELFVFAFLEISNKSKTEILGKTESNSAIEIKEPAKIDESLPNDDVEAKIPEFGYDFDYVVGVVTAESRGEPYEGQIAVAQCILETSQKTLATPEEVVKIKNRYASPCENQEEKELVIDACIDVFVHGKKAFNEPVEYFYSTCGGFVSNWHESNLEYVGTIGNHKFFKER